MSTLIKGSMRWPNLFLGMVTGLVGLGVGGGDDNWSGGADTAFEAQVVRAGTEPTVELEVVRAIAS